MDKTLSGRVTRITAGVFFGLLAILAAKALFTLAAGPPTLLSFSAMVSKLCMTLFYALVIGFTLTRDQPRDRAVGLQPRLTALLGSFLVMASLPWLKKGELGLSAHLASSMLVLLGSALMVLIVTYLGR